MAGDVMILDSIVFTDFAIPSAVNFGSGHMLGVQKLIGGQRVVDAMGADPAAISWQGRFRGPTAEASGQALVSLAAEGRQVTCSWGTNTFLVVVDRADINYEAYFEVCYSVSLTVVEDLSSGGSGGPIATLDDMIGADLAAAQGAGAFQ